MAGVYLVRVYLTKAAIIVAVNIFIGIVFAKANADFCGSVFKTQVGK